MEIQTSESYIGKSKRKIHTVIANSKNDPLWLNYNLATLTNICTLNSKNLIIPGESKNQNQPASYSSQIGSKDNCNTERSTIHKHDISQQVLVKIPQTHSTLLVSTCHFAF